MVIRKFGEQKFFSVPPNSAPGLRLWVGGVLEKGRLSLVEADNNRRGVSR